MAQLLRVAIGEAGESAPAAPAPTRRACQAARLFGLALDEPHGAAAAAPRELAIAPGTVALLTGPSGSGKSTALRRVMQRARDAVWPSWRVVEPAKERFRPGACVDQLGSSVEEAIQLLAFAGLAEARRLVARPAQLSDGERWRLRLALAFAKARRLADRKRLALIVVDEFAAVLDRPCARSVAALAGRFVRRTPGAALVAATSQGDVARALAPNVVARFRLEGPPIVERPARWSGPVVRVRIERGSLRDFDALAPLHYRGGRPAPAPLVLRALRTDEQGRTSLAGVLVASTPTLRGRWRELAWPGRYRPGPGGDRRAVVRRLNEELRCLSRVVVAPPFRGLGVATALVRAYLARPLTIHTEAVASMGRFASFFERAGMTRYVIPRKLADERLLAALESVGIEQWRLAQPRALWLRTRGVAAVERELRAWARAAGLGDDAQRASPERLWRLAAKRVAASPVAYAHAVGPAGKK